MAAKRKKKKKKEKKLQETLRCNHPVTMTTTELQALTRWTLVALTPRYFHIKSGFTQKHTISLILGGKKTKKKNLQGFTQRSTLQTG